MPVLTDTADLRSRVGQRFGPSGWLTVTQERIEEFARATGDLQWIHVDPERAAASAFGGTISHGFLTLSSIPAFAEELLRFEGEVTGINYGLNKVRFPAPVPSGARIRGSVQINDVTPIDSGIQVVETWEIDLEGAAKPACIAECVVRFMDVVR